MRVSMASWTHSALFPVSETCSISTVVNVVAAKYSGARLIRILRSRYFFRFLDYLAPQHVVSAF